MPTPLGLVDGRAELARRVAELDDDPWRPRENPTLLDDLDHFIGVMGRITSAGAEPDFRTLPRASPDDADAVVSGSRVLARLTDAVPEIVTGPLRLDAQYWTSWGKSDGERACTTTLAEAHFVGAQEMPDIEPSTKPLHLGLFTSTGVLGTYGMWRIFLDRYDGGATRHQLSGVTLYDLPWHTWAIEPEPDAVVHEIASASQWVDFVLAHPRRDGSVLYPDWRSAARRYDAVHMTLRVIAATQGLYFPTERGEVAPTFWDIESTSWLRWRFATVRLVEAVSSSAGS